MEAIIIAKILLLLGEFTGTMWDSKLLDWLLEHAPTLIRLFSELRKILKPKKNGRR